MKNIIIFGGAFDPIHFGHLNMALNASKQYDADVYFVPARISVWKHETAPVEDKIAMLNLAIKAVGMGNRFKVSRFEADSENEINYSIDTVKQFKRTFPQSNLFFLIGGDQVNSFHLWKECDEIASLSQIIYFDRKDVNLSLDNIKRFKMEKVEGECSAANSSDIRSLISLETPYQVIEYIISHKLYFINKIKLYLNEDRYNHSVSVAKLAFAIAQCNKLDNPGNYLIAGLLHDIGKNLTFDRQLRIMNDYYPDYIYLNPKIYHQFTGAYLAKTDFKINNDTILNSIMFHTTGKANMTDMEKVVYCADKIDPTRGFDSEDLINSIKVNLDKGFITILKANREYFKENNIDFDNKLTKDCMNYYLK